MPVFGATDAIEPDAYTLEASVKEKTVAETFQRYGLYTNENSGKESKEIKEGPGIDGTAAIEVMDEIDSEKDIVMSEWYEMKS
jgi:hypothetical protein